MKMVPRGLEFFQKLGCLAFVKHFLNAYCLQELMALGEKKEGIIKRWWSRMYEQSIFPAG
jgi:hypothetical protein